MSEIKTPITRLVPTQFYVAGAEDYLITERHTVGDIIRFAISQSDIQDCKYILDEIIEEIYQDEI